MSDLIEKIQKEYADKKEPMKLAGNTYKDLYEYVSELGDGLGKIIRDNLVDDHPEGLEEFAPDFMALLKKYDLDIAENADIVQAAINEKMGIGLKPQQAVFDSEQAEKVVDKITGGEFGNIPKSIENFGMKKVDRTIHKNADFLSRTGFQMKVVREYDNVGVHTDRKRERCEWCLEREGVYDYLSVKKTGSKVWQRHEGCGCSIDFYNENGKRETVNNFVKMTKRSGAKSANSIKIHRKQMEIKEIGRHGNNISDVTKEYLETATPGKGKIVSFVGAEKADVETANWIIRKLGGNIELLDVEKINGLNVPTPDSIKDGMFCEFKKCSSFSTADSRIKKAAWQLLENAERKEKINDRCAILIDITDCKEDDEKMINYLKKIIPQRCKLSTDVIIKDKNELVKVIRYIKK